MPQPSVPAPNQMSLRQELSELLLVAIADIAVICFAKGALTSLDISGNSLGGYFGANYNWGIDMSGVKAVAAAIPECR